MRLIVFDMDGTLIDSQAFIVSTMQGAFVAHGLERPDDHECRNVIGLSLEKALAQVSGLEGAEVDHLAKRYRDSFLNRAHDDFHSQEALYPGAAETVRALAQQSDTLLGVATGKSLRGVERVLGGHDLLHHFVTRQTPDNNPSKPHPGMLHTAMAETGAQMHETAMIGDTVFDIEMAVAAGCAAIGVSWGYHQVDELKAAGAHEIAEDFGQLAALLNTYEGPKNA